MIITEACFKSMHSAPTDGTVVLLYHHCFWYRVEVGGVDREGRTIELCRFIEGRWEVYPGVPRMRSTDTIKELIGWIEVVDCL